MRRIVHLSDLHFGAEIPDLTPLLRKDVQARAAHLVCISGDLTLRAQPAEFRAARAFLESLALPVLAVPGNHDMPRFELLHRFLAPYARWKRHLGLPLEPVWQDDTLLVAGLNSTRRFRWHLDWSAGQISQAQRARLTTLAATRAGRPLVVVTHHPPEHPARFAGRRALSQAEALRETLGALGAAALLVGHLHVPMRLGTTTPELHAGTALSWRDGGHGNSYNVIDISDAGISARVRRFTGVAWSWAEALLPPPTSVGVNARPDDPD